MFASAALIYESNPNDSQKGIDLTAVQTTTNVQLSSTPKYDQIRQILSEWDSTSINSFSCNSLSSDDSVADHLVAIFDS